jgi:hypothetical protein
VYPVLLEIDQVPTRAARTAAGFTIMTRRCRSKLRQKYLRVSWTTITSCDVRKRCAWTI